MKPARDTADTRGENPMERLARARVRIEEIDTDLIRLLAERIAVVREVGTIKGANPSAPLRDATRRPAAAWGEHDDVGQDHLHRGRGARLPPVSDTREAPGLGRHPATRRTCGAEVDFALHAADRPVGPEDGRPIDGLCGVGHHRGLGREELSLQSPRGSGKKNDGHDRQRQYQEAGDG